MSEVKGYVEYEGVTGGVPRQCYGNVDLDILDSPKSTFVMVAVDEDNSLVLIPKAKIIEITILRSENKEGIS